MKTWIIGDLHGSFFTLMSLLDAIAYSKDDKIIFLGDYINKGKYSLDVLKFLMKQNFDCLIGNHEIRLLDQARQNKLEGSFLESYNKKNDVIDWLRNLSWAIVSHKHKAIMVHAAIDPTWSEDEVVSYSSLIKSLLLEDLNFLNFIYQPDNELSRAAWIMTFLRYYKEDGSFSDNFLSPPQLKLVPWFEKKIMSNYRVYFGHWASLESQYYSDNYCSLDGGVAYNKNLVAYCLNDHVKIQVARDDRDKYE